MKITRNTKTRKEEENTTTYLSDDIVFFHILNRLPSKSLIRFSCVSKLWYKTINDDPIFIDSHYNHSKSNPSLVLIFRGSSSGTNLMYMEQGEQEVGTSFSSSRMANLRIDPKCIVGSINGLTCILTDCFIGICNPSTHEILHVPYPQYPELEFLHLCIYGFGFDPLMNVYKVLLIDGHDSVCQIFSLGAGDQDCIWRDVKHTSHLPPQKWDTSKYPLIFSSGALFRVFPHTNTILMFDIHDEKFQVIPGLQVSRDDHLHLYTVCELRGSPCAVYRAGLGDGYEFSLYGLKKQLSGSNSSVGSIHFVFEQVVRFPFKVETIIGFVEFSEQMLLQWVSLWDMRCYVYNSHKKNLRKEVSRVPGWSVYPKCFLLAKHIENLHSLKTLVPQSTSGAHLTEVRYLSSREAML